MGRYVARRLLSSIGVMWAVATVVFLAMRLIPADPAEVVLGDHATQEALTAFRARTGLDRPLAAQYLDFFAGLLRGDLGRSLITNEPVGGQIWSAFPHTLALALASLAIGAAIGIPLGVWTALRRGSWVDVLGRVFALAGFSFPAFYLGILLLLLFSVQLGWTPIIHSIRTGDASEYLLKLVLPALSLGLIQSAYITRLTRSAVLEALGQDWVRTAYAKGLPDRVVHFKHVLKYIMIPIITAMGLYAGTLMGGAVLTETVFNRPGLGKLLVGAIAQRDYILIQSGLMVFAFVILIVNLLVDLSYALFDPRVTYE
jgi:ABC-type dipeptide/oligopeptide/nickel transport system permease component